MRARSTRLRLRCAPPRLSARLAAPLFAIALFACTPSFESVEEVRDLRVLGIAAEPPEAFVDLAAGTAAAVDVRVLVVDPKQVRPLKATAALCFPTDTRLCESPRIDLPPQQQDIVGELTFHVEPTPQLAALIAGALQDDKLKGLGGIRVQFSITVDDGDPNGPVSASKVLLWSTVPPAQANSSPKVDRLRIYRLDGTTSELFPGQALSLKRFQEVGVLPILAAGKGGAETYTTTDLNGRQVTLTENPVYNFFGTRGADWDRARAFEPLPDLAPPGFGIARVSSFLGGQGTLWIVTRDGRGGESWITLPWVSD